MCLSLGGSHKNFSQFRRLKRKRKYKLLIQLVEVISDVKMLSGNDWIEIEIAVEKKKKDHILQQLARLFNSART